MRVVFMGTPDFAVPTLAALIENHEVVGVVTQPDKKMCIRDRNFPVIMNFCRPMKRLQSPKRLLPKVIIASM